MADKKTKAVQTDGNISPLEPKKVKKPKKGRAFLILFIVLILIGVVGFIFRNTLGQFLAQNLSSVPVIGTFFQQEIPYANVSKEEMIRDLERAQSEKENLEQALANVQEEKAGLEQRLSALDEYEARYEDFLNQKEAWDEKIARTDPNMFLEQFEKMYPETMAKIYQDIKIDTQVTKAQKQYASTIAQMEPEQAARALEILIPTDPELIKLIFEGMEQERKALILSNMISNNAATVIKLLSPDVTPINE